MFSLLNFALLLGLITPSARSVSEVNGDVDQISKRQRTNTGYRAITFTAQNTGGVNSGALGSTQSLPGCAIVSQSTVLSVYGIDPNTCHVLLFNTPVVYTVTILSYSNSLIDDATCNSFTYSIQTNGVSSSGASEPMDYGLASLYGLTTCASSAVSDLFSVVISTCLALSGQISSSTPGIVMSSQSSRSSEMIPSTSTLTQSISPSVVTTSHSTEGTTTTITSVSPTVSASGKKNGYVIWAVGLTLAAAVWVILLAM
ncbi:uncharacterized protein IL334_006440 [Kwoniella shivajii]|uniref:Uncharacterized protein n=1 Tax=Kwoniella shivajii TaxID=564305 RepID=A0ABZ1D819_9TREE|nr:hypothetical protein IL334_006440 [Kwoniella shivajii]